MSDFKGVQNNRNAILYINYSKMFTKTAGLRKLMVYENSRYEYTGYYTNKQGYNLSKGMYIFGLKTA